MENTENTGKEEKAEMTKEAKTAKTAKTAKNFLAIDTSSGYLTVAAVKDGREFVTCLPDCAMRHSVLLPEEIDKLLEKADMTLDECDFFAVVVGAGSFTGLRIGISTVKAFCLAFHKPALPVTSFQVAAYNALYGKDFAAEDKKILAIVNALHSMYYACGFDGSGNIILPPCYLSEAEVLKLGGEGYALYAPEKVPLSARLNENEGGREEMNAKKASAAQADITEVNIADPALGLLIAASRLGMDEKNFKEPAALYIRKSQAEINAGG